MPNNKTFTLKQDAYRQTRGGYARFLNIYCANCKAHVLLYQKDGPGVLLRLYLDRIFAPEHLMGLEQIADIHQVPDLRCPSCASLLGVPYIWEEEQRKSFLLREGTFFKQLTRGVYPPVEKT
jgi:hypothetical protein